MPTRKKNECRKFLASFQNANLDILAIAKHCGLGHKAVYHWTYTNKIPMRQYFAVKELCEIHTIEFPEHLFKN